MGAWGALIMSFFGAVFASLTLYWHLNSSGIALAVPFLGFLLIGLAAIYVIRLSGDGIKPTPKEERAIMWSSIGEGIGLFLASNIVINLHRPDLLLPSMALVVGLHFLPIAFAAGFRPFYVLGAALIVAATVGFLMGAPMGGEVSGLMAAGAVWLASVIAIRRDWRAKSKTPA
ncbi:hypothetical protein [Gluconobacter sp. P1D12_c]|uniref:hypothetical protein n=1 Tax=Gluconobacter sp. P1D12_c TaxID=2762614 RepID=UPI001C059949|nr:hypothetical protein [Gluconobacter sp. P1D12_c]